MSKPDFDKIEKARQAFMRVDLSAKKIIGISVSPQGSEDD